MGSTALRSPVLLTTNLARGCQVPWACLWGSLNLRLPDPWQEQIPNLLTQYICSKLLNMRAILNLYKSFFYYKIIFMVPLMRTLWQMHNYSELHFIVFTLKTANVDLVIFISISICICIYIYIFNQPAVLKQVILVQKFCSIT
jgi:hypothetical protein